LHRYAVGKARHVLGVFVVFVLLVLGLLVYFTIHATSSK
jgi:hypothetical protein